MWWKVIFNKGASFITQHQITFQLHPHNNYIQHNIAFVCTGMQKECQDCCNHTHTAQVLTAAVCIQGD